MRLLAILAFLGFIISIILHFLSLFAALIGLKLLWQELWVVLLFVGTFPLGFLIIITGSFIVPGATRDRLWNTALDVMPKRAKRVANGFYLYTYLSMIILAVILSLLGAAGRDLIQENGKYFIQQKNGVRQELTVSEYNIRRNFTAALGFDFPALIYFIQSVYAYSYYILSKQRSR